MSDTASTPSLPAPFDTTGGRSSGFVSFPRACNLAAACSKDQGRPGITQVILFSRHLVATDGASMAVVPTSPDTAFTRPVLIAPKAITAARNAGQRSSPDAALSIHADGSAWPLPAPYEAPAFPELRTSDSPAARGFNSVIKYAIEDHIAAGTANEIVVKVNTTKLADLAKALGSEEVTLRIVRGGTGPMLVQPVLPETYGLRTRRKRSISSLPEAPPFGILMQCAGVPAPLPVFKEL